MTVLNPPTKQRQTIAIATRVRMEQHVRTQTMDLNAPAHLAGWAIHAMVTNTILSVYCNTERIPYYKYRKHIMCSDIEQRLLP